MITRCIRWFEHISKGTLNERSPWKTMGAVEDISPILSNTIKNFSSCDWKVSLFACDHFRHVISTCWACDKQTLSLLKMSNIFVPAMQPHNILFWHVAPVDGSCTSDPYYQMPNYNVSTIYPLPWWRLAVKYPTRQGENRYRANYHFVT